MPKVQATVRELDSDRDRYNSRKPGFSNSRSKARTSPRIYSLRSKSKLALFTEAADDRKRIGSRLSSSDTTNLVIHKLEARYIQLGSQYQSYYNDKQYQSALDYVESMKDIIALALQHIEKVVTVNTSTAAPDPVRNLWQQRFQEVTTDQYSLSLYRYCGSVENGDFSTALTICDDLIELVNYNIASPNLTEHNSIDWLLQLTRIKAMQQHCRNILSVDRNNSDTEGSLPVCEPSHIAHYYCLLDFFKKQAESSGNYTYMAHCYLSLSQSPDCQGSYADNLKETYLKTIIIGLTNQNQAPILQNDRDQKNVVSDLLNKIFELNHNEISNLILNDYNSLLAVYSAVGDETILHDRDILGAMELQDNNAEFMSQENYYATVTPSNMK